MTDRHYVVDLTNDELITGHCDEPHPFKKHAPGCYELAVLVHRLQNAPLHDVERAMDLIEAIIRTSMTSKLQGPLVCPKCMAKMLIFAAVIARADFHERSRTFLRTGRLLASRQSPLFPFTFEQMEAEVASYVVAVGEHPAAIGRLV